MRFTSRLIMLALFVIIFLYYANAVTNGATGNFILSDYIGNDKGIPLYEKEGEEITTTGKLDIAGFYKDILKIGGKKEIIEKCKNDGWKDCIEENVDEQMQIEYDNKMNQMRKAVDIAAEHGIDYRASPFIRDLLE